MSLKQTKTKFSYKEAIMSKKISIDTTAKKTHKCFTFIFNFDSKKSKDVIYSEMKEIMAEYNDRYSIYLSPEEYDDDIHTIDQIKSELEKLK